MKDLEMLRYDFLVDLSTNSVSGRKSAPQPKVDSKRKDRFFQLSEKFSSRNRQITEEFQSSGTRN
jgi:hypothetical protein